MRFLELDGYECRLSDGHVEILGRSGRELVRIPIEAFAEDDYRAALPADLLDRD